MGVEINEQGMRSTTSGHTAARVASGGWVLSWLPGRVLTRGQAVAGIRLADTTGEGLEPGDARWPSLDSWARELDLSGPEAVVRVSTTDAVRERIAHGEVQERAEELYRRHERCANEVRDAMRSGDQQAVRDAQAELRRSQNELSTHLSVHRFEVSAAELPWLRYWTNPTYRQQRTDLAGWSQLHDQAEAHAAGSAGSGASSTAGSGSGSGAGAGAVGDAAADSERGTQDRELWSVDRDGTRFFDHEAVQYWAGAQPGWPGAELSSQVWSALPVDEDVFQAAVEAAGGAGAGGGEVSPAWRERVEQAAAAMGERDPAVMRAWRAVRADETFAHARDLYEARLVAAHESTPPTVATGADGASRGSGDLWRVDAEAAGDRDTAYEQAVAELDPDSAVVREISAQYDRDLDTWLDEVDGPVPSWEDYFTAALDERRAYGLLTGDAAHLNTNTLDPETARPYPGTRTTDATDATDATDGGDAGNGDGGDVVISCGDCELDFDDRHDRGEAAYLAGVHNDLHHAGRPAAVVVPVDHDATEQASTAAADVHDAVQRSRLAQLTARAEAARADAVAMTGPVETSAAGRAWSERVDAAVFGMDAADPAELDRWMQRHADSSQPHVKEAELVAAWETHRATTSSSGTSGQAWDGRLDEDERTATPDPADTTDTAEAGGDVELSVADVGAD